MSAAPTTVAQLNIKVGNDLVNLYADNVFELGELIDALIESGFAQKYHDLHSTLTAVNAVAVTQHAPAALAAVPTQQVAAPPVSTVPMAGAGPICEHGRPAKKIASGISKASGKPYGAFYACNEERGQQCNFRATA